jgi:hypothetical protein
MNMRTLIALGIAASITVGLGPSAFAATKSKAAGAVGETILVGPSICRTDEGYGRFSTCDHGH